MALKNPRFMPRLRFPEFRETEEWEPRTLGRIGEFIGGGTPNTSIPEYWGGDIQWFTPSEINKRNLSKSKRTITSEGLKHSSAKKLPTGTLLLSTRATIGDVGIADNPCATNQGFQSLVVFGHEVNVFWYYWLLLHKCELIKRSSGSTFLEIGKTELKQIPILRPSKDEQQKIADCLGSLDDLIAAEDRKLETLRQHKQGLMQQLFPQHGESIPRLRFPEFRDAPAWREVSLGTLLVRAPDYGVNAPAVPFSKTLPTYIRITDINSDGRFAPCPRVSVNVETDEDRYLKNGDIVLARTGASVGKSYRYREEDGRLIYAGFLIRVRPHPKRLLSQFLAAYLLTRNYWDWVRLTSVRSGQPGINSAEYASMSVSLPPNGINLTEQQKIAHFLKSLDDLIVARSRKIEALMQHRQGLLQQLFPNQETE